ncbi:MAG: GTPase ObgE, partial [Candidatus Neomarinimicrobiota bacterium]|nr:GTPase ObgE [Candidatus Neomarinimicrobiota bacterium]
LKSFNPSLLLKPIILIRTKSDIIIDIDESLWKSIPEYSLEISSITNSGLNELIKLVVNKLNDL